MSGLRPCLGVGPPPSIKPLIKTWLEVDSFGYGTAVPYFLWVVGLVRHETLKNSKEDLFEALLGCAKMMEDMMPFHAID